MLDCIALLIRQINKQNLICWHKTEILSTIKPVHTRALLRLERTMNLLEGGEGRVGERGWGGDGGRVGRGGDVGERGRVGERGTVGGREGGE